MRLEFWGDEVESIRFFDPASQRSQGTLEDLVVLPASEVILDDGRPGAWPWPGAAAGRTPEFWDHVQEGRHFPGIERHLAEFYARPPDPVGFSAPGHGGGGVGPPEPGPGTCRSWKKPRPANPRAGWTKPPGRSSAALRPPFLPRPALGAPGGTGITFQVENNDGLAQELAQAGDEAGRLVPALAQRLGEWRSSGFQVVLVSLSRHRAERLARLLAEEGLEVQVNSQPPPGKPGAWWRSPWANSPGAFACSPQA